MPYIQISTTRALTDGEKKELKSCVFSAASLLNKPRQYVMVHILDGQTLSKGEGAGNAAFCDARILGSPARDACDRFAAKLTDDIARIAQVEPPQIYLTVEELSMCYMDGVYLGGRSR